MKRRLRLLIVEDDPAIAEGLKEYFAGEGFAVTVADDGRVGLSRAEKIAPDVVLLDVNLPGMTGIEVCRQLRERGFKRPILMLSARSESIDRIIGLEAGADDYVAKPFHAAEVQARILAHLRERQRLDSQAETEETPRRQRLLAIMFSDMVGFSRRMNRDERHALSLLAAHNRTLTAAIKRQRGRVVEVIGDAFVASFPSALNALHCAAGIQDDLARRNARRDARDRIAVRIGIHIGDVLEDGGRVRGDAVNVAARLQQLAGAGQVIVSEQVVQAVAGKTTLRFRKVGTRKVKNIRQALTLYRCIHSGSNRRSAA